MGSVEPRSPHRRYRELGAFLDPGWPARRYRFGSRIEADRVGTMLVEIAESRALPAAECMISKRHRDRHIDTDHPDLHARSEIARRIAIAGKDRDAISIFMVIGKAE